MQVHTCTRDIMHAHDVTIGFISHAPKDVAFQAVLHDM